MSTKKDLMEYEVVAVLLAYRQARAALRKGLKGLDLQPGQELLLLALDNDELNQFELVERLKVGQPTVSRGVSRLVTKGLIERNRDKDDDRFTLVRLTAEGLALLPKIRQAWTEVNTSVLRKLSQAEIEMLVELLGKITGGDDDK